jgi:protein-tyrosine phosphatase
MPIITSSYDCSNIAKRLWVGAVPPFDRDLPDFDVLVLCAKELQPAQLAFHGHVIRCPVPDGQLEMHELKRVLLSGRAVAENLRSGKRVLVTCAAGLNRSALVAALALGLVTRMPVHEILVLIRSRRKPDCLYNKHFVEILERYIGNGRRVTTAGR